MTQRSPDTKNWLDELRAESRRRGMRFVSGAAFTLDEVYVTAITVRATQASPDRLTIDWAIDIKPIAVDDILWAAFLPDLVMGPQKRINHRINGAFTVRPERIASGSQEVTPCDAPSAGSVLDEFDQVRRDFIAAHPDVADFAASLERDRARCTSGNDLVRLVTALIAADRAQDAALVADEALARGERGPMSSTVDVLQYLSAYAKGPDAYAEFSASLVPTHRWQVVSDSGGSSSTDLARAHHPGRFAYDLSSLNGVDPWAVVLTAHPPNETSHEHSTMSYLQAAGTADALVIEFCGPAPAGPESASVRSVVGRQGDGMPDAPAGPFEVEIPLPRSKERVGPHEVFTADEAAKLFEAFYRTDKVADGYRLRPVERYLDHP